MLITKMRVKNEVPGVLLPDIVFALDRGFKKAGFKTYIQIKNSSSIKIGLWMRTFVLDTTMHDRNFQNNPHCGGKLTKLPTWEQRVEFNDIVNRVFNRFNVSATIKSGPYIIRQGRKSFTEDDWHDQKPDWIRSNESRGFYIEAIDERQFIEERRERRNAAARLKRLQDKIEKDYPMVTPLALCK